MDQLHHWIDGRFVSSSDGRTFENTNPATGEAIAEVARGGEAEIAAAANAAQAALEGAWGRTTPEQRAEFLDTVADRIEERAEKLALAECRDTGKPLWLARSVDIPRAVANFRFFAGAARHDETGFHHTGRALNYTLRKPVGVMGLITPWNLPLYLLTWKTAPALAMGNTVVAKPSELTPTTATILAEILDDASVPPGVFNVVHGFGDEVGAPLVAHPRVKGISFTGGTDTGRLVATRAAPMFKKLSLEMGGKNPTVVFGDADLDAAVQGAARSAFLNQGQICLCGSRLLVQKAVHDEFVEKLVARTRGFSVGDPEAEGSFLGSLVSKEHRRKVEGYLSLAREEGGEVLCGGVRPELPEPHAAGAFLTPAVVTGLAPDCRAATEEIFGPVLTVHPFEDEEEAIGIANGVEYGLSASLWTKDLARAHRVGARLEAGMVWVNTWMLRDLRTPFGGVKESGVGREGGRWSLDFFSEPVNVCVHLAEEA